MIPYIPDPLDTPTLQPHKAGPTSPRRNRKSHLLSSAIALLACGLAAHASVLWQADTNRGLEVFEGLERAPGTIDLTGDPQGKYGQVYRMTIGDNPDTKERCETRGHRLPDGTNFRFERNRTYYIGWRSMWNPLPVGGWVALWQMHAYGITGAGAPLVLRTVSDDNNQNLHLQNNVNGTNQHIWSTPLRRNVWQSFVLAVYLDPDPTKGWVELWYNGVKQTFINGQQRFYCPLHETELESYNRLKWGIYRTRAVDGTGVAYMSGAKIGTTFADVDPDGGSGTPTTATPGFNPGPGSFATPQTVGITSATTGATIRYTLDGTTPSSTSGTVYTGPVTISSTRTLKAIAYATGYNPSTVASGTYTIGSATTLTYEAEAMSPTHSGTGITVQTDANTSGGRWISLDAENTGSWMEFTTPSIPAGTYQVSVSYKTNNNRGIAAVRVDGTQVGGTIDQYASSSTYPTRALGTVAFSSSGTHKLRMVVSGKNSASSNYVLSADKFTFVRQ